MYSFFLFVETQSLLLLLVLLLILCSFFSFIHRQELEILNLYKSIVEKGPDLFSLHRLHLDATFRCDLRQ